MAEVRPIHEAAFERVEGDFHPTPARVTADLLDKVALHSQWIADNRGAAQLSEARMRSGIVLARRIQWFDNGEATRTAQHHRAWIFFDFGMPALYAPPPADADD